MKNIVLGTTALLLAACGGNSETATDHADTASPNAPSPTTAASPAEAGRTPADARNYVARAGAGDLWEIESSRALLAKSGNEEVKKFARMMIDQHGQSTEKIKAAARSAGVDVAVPRLDADQQRMLDEIKQADAASVDAIYLRHQQAAHAAALELHQGYAARGDTDGLKRTANDIVRVVEMHRSELAKLNRSQASAGETG